MNTTDKIMALSDAYASQAKMVGLASPMQTRDNLRAEIEALVRDAEQLSVLAKLVLQAKHNRDDKDWTLMHLDLSEAAEIAESIVKAAIQKKQS